MLCCPRILAKQKEWPPYPSMLPTPITLLSLSPSLFLPLSQGDTGGPLVCFLNEAWHLVGVTSWGWHCRRPVGYSVSVRVTYFSNWIKDKQRVTPIPNPSAAPPEETPPAMTNVYIPEEGTACLRPRVFLVLLSPATLLLLLLLQSL